MTSQIVADLPFYRQDGSFLGYAGHPAALILELTQPQESGPLVPQDLDGRLFVQRILDGQGAVLAEITGANLSGGRVKFTLTEDDTAALLPEDGVMARDLIHVAGEVTGEGLDPLVTAPFSLRRIRPGLGATVLKLEPAEGIVRVRYAGAPPLTLLQELIAAGDLPADATHEDMVVFWQNRVVDYVGDVLSTVDAAGQTQISLVQAVAAAQVGVVTTAGNDQVAAVGAEGATQVGAVATAGSEQIAAVEVQGATQVGAVATAGNNEVAAIEAEGATQVGAVTAAGNDQVAAVAAEGVAQAAVLQAAADAEISGIVAEGAAQVAGVSTEGANQVAAVEAEGLAKLADIAAATAAAYYEDTTAGLAATDDGDIFLVAGTGDTLHTVYRNDSGVATELNEAASKPYLDGFMDGLFGEAVTRDEVSAQQAVDGSWSSAVFGCAGTPVDGTASTDVTYLLEGATRGPGVVTRVEAYGKNGGGPFKIRRFTLADTTATEQGAGLDLTIVGGVNTLNAGLDFDTYAFGRGEQFGVYAFSGDGKLARQASAGDPTPYRTMTGDVASPGSVTSVNTTSRLEVRITVRYANGSQEVFTGEALARAELTATGETVRVSRWTDAALSSDPPTSPQSISASVGQFDPFILPAGRVPQIDLRAADAGKAFIAFSQLTSAGLKHLRVLPVTLAAGKNTLLAGTHFPPDLVLPAGCIAGVFRPTSGGATVRWASSNPADGSNGERAALFYYRTTTQPVEGATQVATVTATSCALMLAVTVETPNAPRKRRERAVVITDERFTAGGGGALPPSLQQSGGWVVTAGNVASGTPAIQNHLKSVIAGNCHRRVGRVWFEFVDAASHAAAVMDSTGSGTVGSCCSLDANADAFHARGRYAGSSSLPAAQQTDSAPFSMPLTTGRLYMIEMIRIGRTLTYRAIDCVSGEKSSFVIDATAGVNHSLFQTTYGQFVGKFGVAAIAGGVNVKRFQDLALVGDVEVLVITDSLGNANGAAWATSYVKRMEDTLGVGKVWSSAIDGSNAREGVQRLATLLQLIKPRFVLWCMGTNKDNTSNADDSLERWKERTLEAKAVCEEQGADFVPCKLPPSTRIDDPITGGGTLQSNSNDFLDTLGVPVIGWDKRLSLNNDGTTMNPALFVDDAHTDDDGHAAQFDQIWIDRPEIFDAALTTA